MPGLHITSNAVRRVAISLIACCLTPPGKVSAQIQSAGASATLSSESRPNRGYQPGSAGCILYAPRSGAAAKSATPFSDDRSGLDRSLSLTHHPLRRQAPADGRFLDLDRP